MNNEVQTTTRRTNLQIIEDKRKELGDGLIKYKQYLDVIPVKKQEDFKNNFLELATQDYLLSIIGTKDLVRFATTITKTGLDIAPSSKEVYIIPFDTRVNNQKVMLPQAIIPLNGMQQLAYQKGFFLLLDAVWRFDDGSYGSESKLTRPQQAQIQSANGQWVENHFIGFDVILKDLKNELPTQVKFVDLNYIKAATKTLKDERWKLQTWRHKAVRRAYGDFMIPKGRKIEAFEQIEVLNDSILQNTDTSSGKTLTLENEKALEQLGIKLQKFNGLAIASNCFGKEKYLEEFGFVKNAGNYTIEYIEEAQIDATKALVNQANKLFGFLKSKQMTKEQIKEFVNDVLGLTKDDNLGIAEVLEDIPSLELMIEKYLANNKNAKLEQSETASLF